MDPIVVALARLSKAQTECAKELRALTASHADSPAWASAGIAAVVRLCHDPAAAAEAAATLGYLSSADDANDDLIREAGAIPPLIAMLSGGPESEAAVEAAVALANLLSSNIANRAVIEQAGAMPPLAAMLSGSPESDGAPDAARALRNLTHDSEAARATVVEAGAILPLVALLRGGPESEAGEHAAGVLWNLSVDDEASNSIVEAGAIVPLVALLRGGPESAAAKQAAGALMNLSVDDEASNAIVEAGAVSPLVALLRGGPESEVAEFASGALCNLAAHVEGSNAIVEAGAISPLVALLRGGPESEAARPAARALGNLAAGTNATAVMEEVARSQTDCSPWEGLRQKLRACASAQLQAAEAGSAVAPLEHAITLAAAVQVDTAAVERAQARLREINGDAERQERRESFGLGSLALPDEFMCPITMDKMRGVPPPPFPPRQRSRTAATRVPRLRRRPGGGVRLPLIRAVGHRLGAPRRQRLEPAHPRAAAGDLLPKPRPEAAHAGARRGHTARGGHRRGERQRRRQGRRPAAGPRCGWRRAVERARSKAEPSRSVTMR